MSEGAPTVAVDIADDELRILCDSVPILSTASHRLFFTTVLGFKSSEEVFVGYRKNLEAASGRILEAVLRYLGTHAVACELRPAARNLLSARRASDQALEAARAAGERVRQAELFDHPEIPGFKRTLKPYQLPAVAHMCAVAHSANFSVPGSGKTTMVLAAYALIKEGLGIEKLLIIGPRSCFSPWEEEFDSCFGRAPNRVRLSGTPDERISLYEAAGASEVELVLVTYQTASNDSGKLAEYLRRHKTMLVLDESHYIKRISGGVWARTLLDLAPFKPH